MKSIEKNINKISSPKHNDSYWKYCPIVRSNNKKIASAADQSGDINKAILYDSKVLSCGYVGNELNSDRLGTIINENSIINTIHIQQDTENELINYLSDCVNHIQLHEPNSNNLTR